MIKSEYLQRIEACTINEQAVGRVEAVYAATLPDIVKKMISCSMESIFFDDGTRTMSLSEIIDAESDLHVSFKEMGLVPLVDCLDNNFIVYMFKKNQWSKFNIVDETLYSNKNSLNELLK